MHFVCFFTIKNESSKNLQIFVPGYNFSFNDKLRIFETLMQLFHKITNADLYVLNYILFRGGNVHCFNNH